MVNEAQAQQFADVWIKAWNSHDLDAIAEHYADNIEFTSPFAVKLLGDASGIVRGKENLRAYFQKGLDEYPDLHFELIQVLTSVSSVTLYYRSVKNLLAAEVMQFDDAGKVNRVLAHYAPG